MRRCSWTFVIAVIAIVVALIPQGCAWVNQHHASTKHTRHIEHVPGAAVNVESRNGAVQIVADKSRTDVEIHATINCSGDNQADAEQRASQATLEIARGENQALTIKPVFPGGAQDNDGASFSIRLPDAAGITIKTSNGKASVENLGGELMIETSNGSVGVSDHAGSAKVTTSNGSVKITNLKGGLELRTSNGSIDVQQIAGPVDARSSNASVTVALSPEQAGPINLKTSNASVKVRVGAAFVGSVKMNTSNGSIKLVDSAGRVKSRELSDDHGQIVIGEGGDESKIETSNGRIELVIEK